MLGLDPKAARVVWTVVFLLGALGLAWMARTTLLVFTIALLAAYLLHPLVELVAGVLPKRVPPVAAAAVVYLTGIGVLATAGLLLGGRVVEEASQLASQFPKAVEQHELLLDRYLPSVLTPYRAQIAEAFSTHLESGQEHILPALSALGRGLARQLSTLLFAVLIPILAFLIEIYLPGMRRAAVESFAGTSQQGLAEGIVADIDRLLGNYMRAVFLLALATFVSHLVAFGVLGVPYAALLAGACGALEFIPVVGPLSAGVIAVTVAALSGYPHVGWLVVFLILYRLFQDYVVQPWLYSSGIEMHPLLVLFGVLAGEQVAGVTGMFLSVPLLAVIRIVYRRHSEARRGGSEAPLVVSE